MDNRVKRWPDGDVLRQAFELGERRSRRGRLKRLEWVTCSGVRPDASPDAAHQSLEISNAGREAFDAIRPSLIEPPLHRESVQVIDQIVAGAAVLLVAVNRQPRKFRSRRAGVKPLVDQVSRLERFEQLTITQAVRIDQPLTGTNRCFQLVRSDVGTRVTRAFEVGLGRGGRCNRRHHGEAQCNGRDDAEQAHP